MSVTPSQLKRTSMVLMGAAVTAAAMVSVALPASATGNQEPSARPGGYTVKSPLSAPSPFQHGVDPLGEPSATRGGRQHHAAVTASMEPRLHSLGPRRPGIWSLHAV